MHVKYNFSLFIILLLNINLYSQKKFFNYEKIQVKDIPIIEKDSKVMDSKRDYVESENGKVTNYGKLKSYRRESNQSGIIDIRYVFDRNDSIINKINYSWVCSKKSKLIDYSNQFDKFVEQISKDLDLPVGEQGKPTKKIDNNVEGSSVEITERRVNWTYNGASIIIIMVWSEDYGGYLGTEIKWEK